MIGAILGGLSAVASGLSAIQNFQQAKQAQKSANLFGQQLSNIKETNVFRGVQAPDVSSLQAQQTAAQTAQAVQGMGPEGAAQVANIYQAGLQQNAENMQRQAEMNYQNEMAKAQAGQGVEARNIEAQRAFKESQLMGAQQAAADRYNAGMAGIEGLIGGLGTAVAGVATSAQFDYPKGNKGQTS